MKKMYFLVLSFLLLSVASANAQVAIGTTDDPKATLDVVASSSATVADGIIPPRLTGDQIAVKGDSYGTAQNGAIVYATAGITEATTEGLAPVLSKKVVNITAAGYYYYNQPTSAAGEWKALGGAAAPAPAFVVSPIITSNHTITNENLVIMNPSAVVRLTFPTGDDVPVGRLVYVTNRSNKIIELTPVPKTISRAAIGGLDTVIFVYLGGGEWDHITGY